MKDLSNLKIAILVADGFEQSEMVEPREALDVIGIQTTLISPERDVVKAWQHGEWADRFPVDLHLLKANPNDYDALLLPGGVMSPDKLRITPGAIEFIKKFVETNKPLAAICHGPWTLINAQAVKGKKVTSWPSLAVDLKNAGAEWIDQEVVVDGKLVTSRKPADIPAFNKAFITLLEQKNA